MVDERGKESQWFKVSDRRQFTGEEEPPPGVDSLHPEASPELHELKVISMTNGALTKERNFFLAGFFAMFGFGLLFRVLVAWLTPPNDETALALAGVLTLITKGGFVYLTFRLSRFLQHPVWLTIVYCVLVPFSLLYPIPFIALLVGVRRRRSHKVIPSLLLTLDRR